MGCIFFLHLVAHRMHFISPRLLLVAAFGIFLFSYSGICSQDDEIKRLGRAAGGDRQASEKYCDVLLRSNRIKDAISAGVRHYQQTGNYHSKVVSKVSQKLKQPPRLVATVSQNTAAKRNLTFTPDGRFLFYMEPIPGTNNSYHLVQVDTSNGQIVRQIEFRQFETTLTSSLAPNTNLEISPDGKKILVALTRFINDPRYNSINEYFQIPVEEFTQPPAPIVLPADVRLSQLTYLKNDMLVGNDYSDNKFYYFNVDTGQLVETKQLPIHVEYPSSYTIIRGSSYFIRIIPNRIQIFDVDPENFGALITKPRNRSDESQILFTNKKIIGLSVRTPSGYGDLVDELEVFELKTGTQVISVLKQRFDTIPLGSSDSLVLLRGTSNQTILAINPIIQLFDIHSTPSKPIPPPSSIPEEMRVSSAFHLPMSQKIFITYWNDTESYRTFVWDQESEEFLFELPRAEHDTSFHEIVISPDNLTMATVERFNGNYILNLYTFYP